MRRYTRCAWCHAVRTKTATIGKYEQHFCCYECLTKWEARNGKTK